MGLNKPIEYVIPVKVKGGTATAQVTMNLPQGKISRVACFFRDYSLINDGFVRASIQDSTGVDVSKMQSIENYRDRNADYYGGKKPCPVDAGQNFTATVQATESFIADFLVDFLFVYETEQELF